MNCILKEQDSRLADTRGSIPETPSPACPCAPEWERPRRRDTHLCADALDDGLSGAGLAIDQLLDNHDGAAARVGAALQGGGRGGRRQQKQWATEASDAVPATSHHTHQHKQQGNYPAAGSDCKMPML